MTDFIYNISLVSEIKKIKKELIKQFYISVCDKNFDRSVVDKL